MPTQTFHCTIVTPTEVSFSGDVTSVVAPASDGCLGVWARHAPLMSILVAGALTLTDAGGQVEVRRIGAGFLNVLNNDVTILTDACVMQKP